MVRPDLPGFIQFYQAKLLFLVTLICNDLPKSCCIVHLDQCYAVSVPIVFCFIFPPAFGPNGRLHHHLAASMTSL